MKFKLCALCGGNLAAHLSLCPVTRTRIAAEIEYVPSDLNDWVDLQLLLQDSANHPVQEEPGEEASRLKPIFSEDDYSLVRQAMQGLSNIERKIVYLRFWRGLDLEKVSQRLGIQARSAESNLKKSFLKLKSRCLADPKFSRNQESCRSIAA